MKQRTVKLSRKTAETDIQVTLTLEGSGQASVNTGLGFLDHMLVTLARHASFDLELKCVGDLAVDDHHTVEDCGLLLGQALDQMLGERCGIARFGWAYAPLDEALARAVVDLSGRPCPVIELGLTRYRIGQLATENLGHFLSSFSTASRIALHIDVLRGANDHHRAEAAFKALALALKHAVAKDGRCRVPSTKEVLG